MAKAERRANVVWSGNLQQGSGTFELAFSHTLAEQGNEPEELSISAVCTFHVDQLEVATLVLDVQGRVPGLDAEGFQSAAEQADQGCPVSNALRGNVDMQINASLN